MYTCWIMKLNLWYLRKTCWFYLCKYKLWLFVSIVSEWLWKQNCIRPTPIVGSENRHAGERGDKPHWHTYLLLPPSACNCTEHTYRIAGNFRGRKLLRISRFCSYICESFLRKIGWHSVLWRQHQRAIHESKILFSTNSWKFSLSNIPAIRYMQF